MPLDEGFGFGRDAEVLFEARPLLADLGVPELDEQPVAFLPWAPGEVEADDDTSIREPVAAERNAHRPQRYEGVQVLGGQLEPTRTPLAERLADLEEVVA